jgi:hypothetical protein
MNEELFYQAIQQKAQEYQINPLLLLSGIEGVYSFKNVALNTINYHLLDSLILTILALRIGDQFHTIAEKNMLSPDPQLVSAAGYELQALSSMEIGNSPNHYLRSFAEVLNGKSVIRRYHIKALEVAAREIEVLQKRYDEPSIGAIMLAICKTAGSDLYLDSLFG